MHQYLILAAICLAAMVSPGPDFVLITRNALTMSKRRAFATAFGVVCGCVMHAIFCVLGLAIVISQSVVAFSIVKYLGAAYLVYIGIKSFRASEPAKGSTDGVTLSSEETQGSAFLQGFFCNALNPKLAVFLLSLFTQFIEPHAAISEKVVVASVFVVEAAIYWPLLVIILQSGPIRAGFSSMKTLLDRVCGTILIALGARIAFRS